MKETCALSVIMPACNAEQTIAAALDSVWRQTWQPAEVIVIDDGSTDGTARLLAASEGRIRRLRQANAGPSAARNRGLELAAGDAIAFLDADDLWPDFALETLLKHLMRNPDADIVRGRVRNLWATDFAPGGFELDEPVWAYNLGSAVFRRHVFATVGGFDPSMRSGEDIDFWVRARERGVRTITVEDVTLLYRRKLVDLVDGRRVHFRNVARILKRSLDRTRGNRS
ncbi:MAG: glycosyltransferase family 2 protein [Bryobacteraceae bacterium]|nr:glycosyltransferase family 2 protein [Bryobacteraceae bacterium]